MKLSMKFKVVSSVRKLGMCVLSMECKDEDSIREQGLVGNSFEM